jgi:hypothetical protein
MKKTILLLFLLLFPVFVHGVGISGFDLDIETIFVPNSQFRFDFIGICNTDTDDIDYSVYAKADLTEYVVFDQTLFPKRSRGCYIPIGGYINFPDSLPPRQHRMKVCFLESCPGQGAMCGRTGACAVVIVNVPFNGIYPVVSLDVPNVNEKEPITFIANINNPGTDTIQSCSGFVDVFNKRKEPVGNAEFESSGNITTFGSASIKATIDDPTIPPGDYSAFAKVDCDGVVKDANATFRVGTLDVKLVNFTKELETGGIKRFVTNIESTWNDPLDVYANIRIYDDNNSTETKTVTNRMMPWQTLELEAFIDTSKLEAKQYDLAIDVFYADKISHFNGRVDLVKPVESVAPVMEKEKPGMSASTLTIILVIIVLFLTAVNAFLAFYRKKKE